MAPDNAVFDFVIVGGGTAGCVLASRLSEDAHARVLLLESGRDIQPGSEPADILSLDSASSYAGAYRWMLPATNVKGGPACLTPQARVLGGGSNVMGMVALQGIADDYDSWSADHGAKGWAWSDVRPWFQSAVRDLDFSGDGPTQVVRTPRADWPPLSAQFGHWAQERGLAWLDDLNGADGDGHGQLPAFSDGAHRQSSSICYLTAKVRARPNLTILTHAQVEGIRFIGRTAHSVQVLLDGAGRRDIRSRNVVLAAGALFTPALLLRSGIGDPGQLQSLGIEARANLPGVGLNLQNHPMLFMSAFLPRSARQPQDLKLSLTGCMRYSSGLRDCPNTDMYIAVFNKSAPNPMGARLATLQSYLLKPRSRGTVQITSPDPAVLPKIDFNLFDDEHDVQRGILSLQHMAEFATSRQVRLAANTQFFCVNFSDRLRKLNEQTWRNSALSASVAKAIDHLPLPTALARKMLGGGPSASEVLEHAMDLRAHVREYVSASGHHAGTCKMGVEADRMSVVDTNGKVHGLSGLYAADASIMPAIPRANTNLPTLMVAEKIAAQISRHHKGLNA